MPRTVILGTGSYVPEQVVTNEDLTKRLNTTDEWILQRSGVRERRYAKQGETPSSIAAIAARRALEAAEMEPKDLDFIIAATQTVEATFPGIGCFLQGRLDCPGIGALDVRDQCTGFLYGWAIADAFIRQGVYKKVLLVGSEIHSTGLEWSDNGRHITVLFGDGAGAVILGPSEEPDRGIVASRLHADGRYARELWTPAPNSGMNPRLTHEMLDQGMHYPRMNGRLVFKEAVKSMVAVSEGLLAENGLSVGDVDHFIPHQANLRINEAVAKLLGLPVEKMDTSIERYGNCASASVPIALDERVRSGAIQKGDLVLFATFAAGFTWGGSMYRW